MTAQELLFNSGVRAALRFNLQVARLSESAVMPSQSHENGDAGYDLFASEKCILEPNRRVLIRTGIAMVFPDYLFGRICDPSGNAWKKGWHTMAGIIDPNYRGDIGVVLFNTDHQATYSINPGDKIAQIVFQFFGVARITEIEKSQLELTDRGSRGLGENKV